MTNILIPFKFLLIIQSFIMAIILKENILYLHIPKTGGNFLTRILHDCGLIKHHIGDKHATYDLIYHGLKHHFNGMLLQDRLCSFCVVRHPLRWYESWFKYQNWRGWMNWGYSGELNNWHVLSDMNRNKSYEFNEFMRYVNNNNPGFVTQLYGRYTNGTGVHILKTESIVDDFLEFCNTYSIPIDHDYVRSHAPQGVSPKVDIHWSDSVYKETIENEMPAFKLYQYEP